MIRLLRSGRLFLCLVLFVSGCASTPDAVLVEKPKADHLKKDTPAPWCSTEETGDLVDCIAGFGEALRSCNADKAAID